MKSAFMMLPGPIPVKILITIILAIIVLISLHYIYEWMGNVFLDTGGGIG